MIWARSRTFDSISSIQASLDLELELNGWLVNDEDWQRQVKEILWPAPFRIQRNFIDALDYLRDENILEQMRKERDMWWSGIQTIILPQLKTSTLTRRAILTIPFACKSVLHVFVRDEPEDLVVHCYSYWRSILDQKLPADLLLFQEACRYLLSLLTVEGLAVASGSWIIQLGSYHKKV